MEIKIIDLQKANVFVELFQYLKQFVSIISLTLKTDQFYIQGMDSSQISIFEISLMNDWFDEYKIEKDTVIGLNVNIFAKILHIYSNPQTISLIINEDNMEIKFESDTKDFNKEFVMPLVEFESEHLSIPEKEYDMDIEMESKKFKNFIDELAIFGDVLTIKYEDENVVLTSQSDTEGSMKLLMKAEDLEECTLNEEVETICSFRIKYLQYMTQYYKLSKYILLNFSNGMPMHCKYVLHKDEKNFIRFHLAPVMDD